MTLLVRTRAELAQARAAMTGSVGLVATMGALHEGHDAIVSAAQAGCASVLVSVFVNPAQFERSADLIRYPRVLAADLARCEKLGVDLVWAPEVTDMYPHGPVVVGLTPGPLGSELEGATRPGHFAGVLSVVAKLIGLVRPEQAYFGEKDYQQLVLVRQLVTDLELGTRIVAVPTVREPDGLAMSSRNVFLSPAQRAEAAKISAALQAAHASNSAADVLAAARAILDGVAGFNLDYLQLRDQGLGAAASSGVARLLVAGWFGETRLIDNCEILLPDQVGDFG